MNFETFRETVLLRAKPFDKALQIEHAQIGMLTELGELGDLIKRAFVYGKEFDKVNLLEECGDYLWYYVLLCDQLGVSMATLDQDVQGVTDAFAELGELGDVICERKSLRVLAKATGDLARFQEYPDSLVDARSEAFACVLGLLFKHDFTVAECLAKNDAKLEARTGKKFDASKILNRDIDAERQILEA